jgi:solute carrier family 8 (sodium/calcium exchanger)
LIYLFLGISINADIFMESIEVITSSTIDVIANDKDGNLVTYQVPKWNPTIANLTLMALGSSAPEILLSVIESLKDLGEPAGVLGPASIVGSGAFNLLVISGISILSVDAPKKINDLRVYTVTATFSLFSYTWMYICLEVTSPEIVTITEAWLTLFFFFLLVGTAFAADKCTQRAEARKKCA